MYWNEYMMSSSRAAHSMSRSLRIYLSIYIYISLYIYIYLWKSVKSNQVQSEAF